MLYSGLHGWGQAEQLRIDSMNDPVGRRYIRQQNGCLYVQIVDEHDHFTLNFHVEETAEKHFGQ